MMPTNPEGGDNFDRRWLHDTTREHENSVVANLRAVKEFAYQAFDALDTDGNGFLSRHELLEAMKGGALNNREKSFVLFLLNNHPQIESMNTDARAPEGTGISRTDIELYFQLISNLI